MNMGTIAVLIILCLVVLAVIASMVRDRSKGKNTCGCGLSCGGCQTKNCAKNQ